MSGCCNCTREKSDIIRTIYSDRISLLNPTVHQAEDTYCCNSIVTSRYTWWSFFPLNIYEQFHHISNIAFANLSFLYLFASGATSAYTTVAPLFIAIAIAVIKDGVYDIFRHKQDKKVNNILYNVLKIDTENCKLYWTIKPSHGLRVGDIVRCEINQEFPCDLILLASSDLKRQVRITTSNLDGETNIKTYLSLTATHDVYHSFTNRNLKDKQLEDPNQMQLYIHKFEAEGPNVDLHRFEGKLVSHLNSLTEAEQLESVTPENVVLRGSKLKNTNAIIGLALYTGKDTKLSLNSKQAQRKYTSRESKLNVVLAMFILVSIILCIIFAGVATYWEINIIPDTWYVQQDRLTPFSFVQRAFSFAFIVNYLLPISLIITVELQQLSLAFFIQKDDDFFDDELFLGCSTNTVHTADELGQIEFLFTDKTGTLTQNVMTLKACYALSNDDLYLLEGQKIFGLKTSEADTQDVTEALDLISTKSPDDTNVSLQTKMENNELECLPGVTKDLYHVLEITVLCHSVEVICLDENSTDDNDGIYQATSPDEKALIEAAANVGMTLIATNPDPLDNQAKRLTIQDETSVLQRTRSDVTIDNDELDERVNRDYVVDLILQFDSVRKRMTVLARHPDGTYHIHSKGAETCMLEPEACSLSTSQSRTRALEKANEFGLAGLRTLVLASRKLEAKEYNALLKEYRDAQSLFAEERARALAVCTQRIESGLELVGVTGVEDQLQIGVKQCLEDLREAGIQIWVLTGDKEETAVTVSQAAGHFPESMTLIKVTNCTNLSDTSYRLFQHLEGMDARKEQRRVSSQWKRPASAPSQMLRNDVRPLSPSIDEIDDVILATLDSEDIEARTHEVQRWNSEKQNRKARRAAKMRKRLMRFANLSLKQTSVRRPNRKGKRKAGASGESMGLVIDGASLKHALHPTLRSAFLDLCMSVTTVLCCRMTPLQKASIIERVRVGLAESGEGGNPPVTAAIGDGGNDVAMILQANVGIGIYGKEGREAVRAADYALPQFRFLRRLLLVHGHWSYHRISQTMLLFYHKCVAFVTTQIILAFFSGYSANTWHSSITFTLYNLTMTSIPNLLYGIFERHLTDHELLAYPRLYRVIFSDSRIPQFFAITEAILIQLRTPHAPPVDSTFNPMTQAMTFFCSFIVTMIFVYAYMFTTEESERNVNNMLLEYFITRHANLRIWWILLFVLDGVWQGTIIFFVIYYMFLGGSNYAPAVFIESTISGADQYDFSLCGVAAIIFVVVSVVIRVYLRTRDFTWIIFGGMLFTFIANFILFMVVQLLVSPSYLDFMSYMKVMQTPTFWCAFPFAVLLANLPALFWRILSDQWWQRQMHKKDRKKTPVVRRISLHNWLDERRVGDDSNRRDNFQSHPSRLHRTTTTTTHRTSAPVG